MCDDDALELVTLLVFVGKKTELNKQAIDKTIDKNLMHTVWTLVVFLRLEEGAEELTLGAL